MVIYIARLFAARYKTAIVSRGYGGRAANKINVVSDGREIFLSSREAGDEPRLLAESLPGVAVLTGSRRALSGRYAVENMQAELVIMDDGFQHMALERDCNLVLFSAAELLGNGWVCPGGPLREPFSALRRADAFVITGVDPVYREKVDQFAALLARGFPGKPLFRGSYRPVGLLKGGGTEVVAPASCKTLSFLAFCGIAAPQSFKQSLLGEGLIVKEFLPFGDHYPFRQTDIDRLQQLAVQAGCDALVSTAKDFVKLQAFSFQMPLWILKVELQMEPGFQGYLSKSL
jgi:tetraacyldisaccharide 4'-kinase